MSRGLRFLILNTDYPVFIRWLYAQHPGLEKQPCEEQMQARVESLFGVADFYSSNLRKLGHEAWDIHANNEFMQKAWAKEHGIRIEAQAETSQWRQGLWKALRVAPATVPRQIKAWLRSLLLTECPSNKEGWFYEILEAQIKHYKPDVLLVISMPPIAALFLREMAPYVRLLVGQIAAPLPPEKDFGCYELILSSLPNIVKHFRHNGIPTELQRLAFEPRILSRLKNEGSKIPVSFVGSLSHNHKGRILFLEHQAHHLDIHIWGQGIGSLARDSRIRQHYRGESWGIEMYQILRNSTITLNHHIDIAESYANNMRLFEATGVGTLLITDWKVNLHGMFEPGKEVVAYRTPEECIELVRYYLEHGDEREAIAHAGQARTLREHTYYQRVQELVDIVRKYL
jgi:spore maturation protein CgeB